MVYNIKLTPILSILSLHIFSTTSILAMDKDVDLKNPAPTSISIASKQPTVKENIACMGKIMKDNGRNSMQVHADYAKLGDQIIDLLNSPIPQQHKEQMEAERRDIRSFYKENKMRLNSSDLMWLAMQTAMALTPPEARKRQEPGPAKDWIDNLLQHAQTFRRTTPFWLYNPQEIDKYSQYFPNEAVADLYKDIVQLSLYQPFVPTFGNGVFTLDDWVSVTKEAYAFYGLSADEDKDGVHGGIYKSMIEKFLHDILHASQYLKQTKNLINRNVTSQRPEIQSYNRAVINVRQQIAQRTYDALKEGSSLDEKERKKLLVCIFLFLHETMYQTEKLPDDIHQLTLLNAAKKFADLWKTNELPLFPNVDTAEEFYKEKLPMHSHTNAKITSISAEPLQTTVNYNLSSLSSPLLEEKRQEVFRGDKAFEYLLRFDYDTAGLLKEYGLWESSEKMGKTYKLSEIRSILINLHEWFINELEEGGKLYPYFK